MSLARPILLRRIRNDMEEVSDRLGIPSVEFGDDAKFPIAYDIHISGVEGYCAPGQKVSEHDFTIFIGEDYPYERPKVRWTSRIFHPNIMDSTEGGIVCVMALDHWDFESNLCSFVESLIDLVKNPNPSDPLRSETCEAAAKWFSGSQ